MKIQNILKENKCNYTLKKIGNVSIYNLNDTKMLIVIENKGNVFSITRDIFNEIDEELLPYSFCLIDKNNEKIYFIEIKEPNNFLRNGFDSTKKEIIYFGKQVLNNEIKENELINKIERYW